MSAKASEKNAEELQAALQALIAQGRKEGMVRSADLNAILEKMDMTPEKIEEVYDRFEAMNIQVVSPELELDLEDDVDLVDNPDAVTVTEVEGENTVLELRVAPEDMGKVIGRQGRIAKEIRTIIKSVAQRDGQKVSVEIVD